MDDTTNGRPNLPCLFASASGQHGYFTIGQAHACGFSRFLAARHAATGRFIRVRHGLYRLRDYPSSQYEEIVAAWLALGKDVAVVSHESALDLHDLSDVIPNAVHLTVPRSKRHHPDLPGVKVHTTIRPLPATDVSEREGIRVTAVARTIMDAAEYGTGPEQIEMAIKQALRRGLTTHPRLEHAASDRSRRVRDLVTSALAQAA